MDRDLDVRLRELRIRLSLADPLFMTLVQAIERVGLELQIGLAVVTGGGHFRGVPTGLDLVGDQLNLETRWMVRVLRALNAGSENLDWIDVLEEYADSDPFSANARMERESREKVDAYLETLPSDADYANLSPADFPDDSIADAVLQTSPIKAFTLKDAQVRLPGGSWESIGSCRVLTAAVEAWWTFPLSAPDEIAADVQRPS